MRPKINISQAQALIGLIVILFISLFIQYKFFLPKIRTDWNKEMNHQRDSIIKELKREGIFFNDKD